MLFWWSKDRWWAWRLICCARYRPWRATRNSQKSAKKMDRNCQDHVIGPGLWVKNYIFVALFKVCIDRFWFSLFTLCTWHARFKLYFLMENNCIQGQARTALDDVLSNANRDSSNCGDDHFLSVICLRSSGARAKRTHDTLQLAKVISVTHIVFILCVLWRETFLPYLLFNYSKMPIESDFCWMSFPENEGLIFIFHKYHFQRSCQGFFLLCLRLYDTTIKRSSEFLCVQPLWRVHSSAQL